MRHTLAGSLPVPLLLLLAIAGAVESRPQESYSRVEAGAHFAGIKLFDSPSTTSVIPGFGGRLDFNLNRRMAIEAQVDFYPQSLLAGLRTQGGSTLVVTAGLRGKFLETRRFALYGVVRPGLIHFTNTIRRFDGVLQDPGPPPVIAILSRRGPVTHFALDLGGGIEFYPAPRWILRIGVDETIYRVQGEEFPLPGGTPTNFVSVSIPSGVDTSWRLNLGVGYRLGALRKSERESRAGAPGLRRTICHPDPCPADRHLGTVAHGAGFRGLSGLSADAFSRCGRRTFLFPARGTIFRPARRGKNPARVLRDKGGHTQTARGAIRKGQAGIQQLFGGNYARQSGSGDLFL